MPTRALIGTGLYDQSKVSSFFGTWVNNTDKYMPSGEAHLITRIACLSNNDTMPLAEWGRVQMIQIPGNLGHVGDLLNGSKKYEFCGWSSAVLALAMIAYCDESDFIYKEQDCLAFGPWVEQLYADMGDGNMVFGGQMKSSPWMPTAQSLFLVRHSFIPHFIWRYLNQGTDNDVNNLPEHKFAKMLANEPHHFRKLSFGVDRERPIPWEDKVFYVQKLCNQELIGLRNRGLL